MTLPRSALADGLAPPLHVDEALSRRRTDAESAVGRGRGTDAYSAADGDTVRPILPLFHQAGDLDHGPLVRFDVGHHRLGSVHADVRPLGDVDASRVFDRPGTGREDITFRAA